MKPRRLCLKHILLIWGKGGGGGGGKMYAGSEGLHQKVGMSDWPVSPFS